MPIKRIAVLSVHTSPFARMGGAKIGGMNIYIQEFAREMASHSVEIDIFTRRYADDLPDVEYHYDGMVRLVHVNAGPAQALDPLEIYPYVQQFTAGVVKFATQYQSRYDVTFSHYWLSGLVARSLREMWGVPFVQMFHTLGHMKNRIAKQAPALPDIRVIKETEIVHEADRILASTPAEQTQLIWLYRADRKKIDIVPPGVDTSRFFPKRKIAPSQLSSQLDDRDLLLYVGRIEHLKALDTVFEALHLIRQRDPAVFAELQFGIVGGDPKSTHNPEMIRLQRLVDELALENSVHFLGAKDHAVLPDYYAAATAVMMTSEYESFGMAALEAMAVGTPVIASEVGGLAFLVQDGNTGFLVPVRDAEVLADRIIELVSDIQLQKRFRHNAAALARSYDWAEIVDRAANVLESARGRVVAAV